jgi:hypothetical protein
VVNFAKQFLIGVPPLDWAQIGNSSNQDFFPLEILFGLDDCISH